MNYFNDYKIIYMLTAEILFNAFSCGQTIQQKQNTSSLERNLISEDTCSDPDADINCSFINMPENLSYIMNITDKSEPGTRISISGTIYKPDGKTPFPDVIIYAYHTDNKGNYSKKGNEKGVQRWHGYLHGWCKTDINGKYEINSIKPERYPSNDEPAHIHAAIKESGNSSPYHITDFVFSDDVMVNQEYLSRLREIGGTGVVDLKVENETLTGKRDIILKK